MSGALSLNAAPAAALSLNPLDYYSYDYYIALSHSEVEPEEPFSVTAGATVRCTKDLPIGVRQAVVQFKVLARHSTSGEELTLRERYELTVSSVPDWAGDEYSTTETVELSFPSGTPPGAYTLVARLEHLSLDGWNVTSMVPSSARSMGLGSIVCSLPDVPPAPPPPAEPGSLVLSILGHEFRTAVDEDGYLLEDIDAPLIEGLLTLEAAEGTRCLDGSGDALTYLAASLELSPRPYDRGTVLRAFSLRPDGASFSPSLRLGIAYDVDELPPGCEESQLTIAFYDRSDNRWQPLPSTVDAARKVVTVETPHFTLFGLLAPTSTPGPARFSLRGLDVSPVQVPPFGRVDVAVTISNTGDTADAYALVVRVAGTAEHSETLLLQPRQTRVVRLTVVRAQPGAYEVSVEHLSRVFVVTGPSSGITPSSATATTVPTASPQSQPAAEEQGERGMNPVYIALLALAGIAFIALVVLVLSGAL